MRAGVHQTQGSSLRRARAGSARAPGSSLVTPWLEIRELEEELAATRTLAAQEEAALHATIEELEERVRAAESGGGAPLATERELINQVHKLTTQLADAQMQAARSAAAAEDAIAELQALRTLSAAEEAALRATIEELTIAAAAARRSGAAMARGDDTGRVQELEAQVAALLVELDGTHDLSDELLSLRPKAARCDELEREVRELRDLRS
eukprot:CAMPEP_0119403736 /NCGR_PEP_ID=MMETSP1334-20130426/143534_1 /TAXON_ID=127549 /ORGANISM="Calcidiscus leptoporus, Strain RCC1130" /LENGTH=209 /DNA_ID=CAMNT_0007427685 /DNA_START=344 /DNA_END=973 /DNA_ORIENTATION=-